MDKYNETLEKAKAYDEALKLMRDCVPDEDGLVHVRPSDIFPELKESKDEEIRKALINVFATHKDYEVFFGVSVDDIVAWLEKQGERHIACSEEQMDELENEYLKSIPKY